VKLSVFLAPSLDNLSAEDVMELRRTSERSLVLDRVSSTEYLNWFTKSVMISVVLSMMHRMHVLS